MLYLLWLNFQSELAECASHAFMSTYVTACVTILGAAQRVCASIYHIKIKTTSLMNEERSMLACCQGAQQMFDGCDGATRAFASYLPLARNFCSQMCVTLCVCLCLSVCYQQPVAVMLAACC